MILLDKPLISDFVKESIRQGKFTALDTGNMLDPGELECLSEHEVINTFKANPGQRLHCTSENAIGWIEKNLGFTKLPGKINLFKDKFLFRELTKDLFPGLFYAKHAYHELEKVDASTLPFPLIIKPNVGFFSMGVHKVFSQNEWNNTLEKINREVEEMQEVYPESVLNTGNFIIEECIEGTEYAVDAYFNDEGESLIVGIMKHLFGGADDVSDRVYLTSAGIVEENLKRFNALLEEIGKRADLKNFSLHIELRVDDDGLAVPIEVNPLRFGAWCTSADLMHYAYGYNPYEYYIKGLKPDWKKIIANSDKEIYSINIFENSTPYGGDEIKEFQYEKMLKNFSHPLELRKINFRAYPIFGILFARTPPENTDEIDKILFAKMEDYIN